MAGIFGSLFDFNGDGELDALERSAEFQAFSSTMGGMDADANGELRDFLDTSGLEYDDLVMMDENKRREMLEKAGLDPDEYFI